VYGACAGMDAGGLDNSIVSGSGCAPHMRLVLCEEPSLLNGRPSGRSSSSLPPYLPPLQVYSDSDYPEFVGTWDGVQVRHGQRTPDELLEQHI
jgi:hypothetical protein